MIRAWWRPRSQVVSETQIAILLLAILLVAGGALGILAVGTSLLDSLRKFADCLDFIQKQVSVDWLCFC